MVLVPLLFSILVGEICYNIRAALDYLIFELARLDSGKIQEGTQFPIDDQNKNFAGNGHRRLIGLDARHIALIEALQPYNGCNWTRLLRDISNPDKHRNLSFAQGDFELQVFPATDRLHFLDLPGKISSARHPITGAEVHVQTNLTLEVQFSDGTPVVQSLEEIKTQVAATLEAFKADFK